MKKLLLSSAALVALTAGALAADLPARRMAPAPAFVAAPMYNWSGLYVGGHVGWGSFDSSATATTGTGTFPVGTVFAANDGDGAIGGGQVGFNWQMGSFVFGVEGDIAATDIESSAVTVSPITTAPFAGRSAETNINVNWVATATARAGFAVNNFLFYVKGGWAWADVESDSSTVTAGGALIATTTGGETRDGYTIGGGVEWGFTQNWTLKLEYNYIDFGTESVTRTSTTTAAFGGGTQELLRDNEAEMHLAKVGINFKF